MDAAAADLIVFNARITTLDRENPRASAIAVTDGIITKVGDDRTIMRYWAPSTKTIDAHGKCVVPGLNDSHQHLIRGGLNYLLELRWDGVSSVADALDMLKAQVAVTPPPQWVRVVGGFTEHQFAEKRLPTLEEINALAPDTPVFILHLYDRALLNQAALRAVGYTRETPNPPGGEIQRDPNGNPTGLLIARPNAALLYTTLAKGPKLSPADQVISTRHFMQELNRLGVTSVIDAGGGFQNYPEDYGIIESLSREDHLTVRIAYNLFTQNAGRELEDFQAWTHQVKPGQGTGMYRHNGAGEMLVFSAADFEDFREPRPELAAHMEGQLFEVTLHLVRNRWPFRIHGTYDESISRFLDVFERVDAEVPFEGLHWMIDHAETISQRNIDRVVALGGGIAVQHRMAYQGEAFIERYGRKAAEGTPPVRRMLDSGAPVGMGTDATRVASYNPWVGVQWLVTGKTIGGTLLYPPQNRLDRETALRLYTEGSSWFSTENGRKGALKAGKFADFAVLNEDLFGIQESSINRLRSVLTVVGGRVVYASEDFVQYSPPPLPISLHWSPARRFGGYQGARPQPASLMSRLSQVYCQCKQSCGLHRHNHAFAYTTDVPVSSLRDFWGVLGCSCWA